MNPLRQLWRRSILARVSSVLGAVTLLALAVILIATVFTEQATGKASAINVAGSLRMQSYSLAARLATMGERGGVEAVRAAIEEFERRLASPLLLDGLADDEASALRAAHARIAERWRSEVRPRAETAIDSAPERSAFLGVADGFVEEVNRFVERIETDLEGRIRGLRVWLGVAFFAIVVLVVTALALLHIEVFDPLSELLRSARAVRSGSFRARVSSTGVDEMGQLGQAFNEMVEQLARLYGSLEKEVAEKTADLERRNRSLALLYDTTCRLSEKPPLETATLAALLENLKRVVGVFEGGVICVHRGHGGSGVALVRDDAVPEEVCAPGHCAGCHDSAGVVSRLESTERGERRIVRVPLTDGGRRYGMMPLVLAPGKGLEPWQLELTQTVGRHLGAALAAAERREEQERLALLEERSAIARELHDSIAQSLSYSKIQLTRLASLIDAGAAGREVREVLAELREGVASAYRQLRELLATFRLKPGSGGFAAALRATIVEFERHSGVPVAVVDDLDGIGLSANDQIHVLQIVREALTNVEKHARARNVALTLAREDGDAVCVTIDDDGVGLDPRASPRHHFGLAIMRERAALLGGHLEVGRREAGGTRVRLRFPTRPHARHARRSARAGTDRLRR